jgi:hypothetical protein
MKIIQKAIEFFTFMVAEAPLQYKNAILRPGYAKGTVIIHHFIELRSIDFFEYLSGLGYRFDPACLLLYCYLSSTNCHQFARMGVLPVVEYLMDRYGFLPRDPFHVPSSEADFCAMLTRADAPKYVAWVDKHFGDPVFQPQNVNDEFMGKMIVFATKDRLETSMTIPIFMELMAFVFKRCGAKWKQSFTKLVQDIESKRIRRPFEKLMNDLIH